MTPVMFIAGTIFIGLELIALFFVLGWLENYFNQKWSELRKPTNIDKKRGGVL